MRHPLSSNYIFVGIGHAGGKILCNLKQRFHEEVISENEEKEIPVSFLYIDSSDDLISKDDSNANKQTNVGRSSISTNHINSSLNIQCNFSN